MRVPKINREWIPQEYTHEGETFLLHWRPVGWFEADEIESQTLINDGHNAFRVLSHVKHFQFLRIGLADENKMPLPELMIKELPPKIKEDLLRRIVPAQYLGLSPEEVETEKK